MGLGLFMCGLSVDGSEYGERVNGDRFLMGMENRSIHEQAWNEDEKEYGYSGYECMKCEGIGVSYTMKTWMGLLFALLIAGEDEYGVRWWVEVGDEDEGTSEDVIM